MYLKSLRLENVACFEELDLDFTDENGDPCKWVVLLGENGTGKTSILKSIVLALGMTFASKFLQASRPHFSAVVGVVPDAIDYFDKDISSGGAGLVGWNWTSGGSFGLGASDEAGGHYQSILNGDFPGWFIGGYGPKRRLNPSVDDRDLETSQFTSRGKRVFSLLGLDDHLTPPKVWLSNLDYESLKLGTILREPTETEVPTVQGSRVVRKYSEEERAEAKRKFQKVDAEFTRAVRAIEGILPKGTKFVEVTPEKDVIFEENGVRVSLDVLSDGYQSTMAWVGDLVRRLCEAFPDMDNPLEATGVVLVDEIDLHLHPRWQRTIVKQIRETFPNLQFIVTSHSPFVAQDMTEKDKIIVLTRDGDKVTARHEKGFVKGWRADQILTSWLFGLETSRDEEIESLEKERRVGLQRAEGGTLTEAERLELDRVTNELEAMRSSDVAPDRQKLEAAANLVMELMSKAL